MSYAWEKYKTNKDLMMTRQEVRDESKNSEGDQQVKARQRRRRLGRGGGRPGLDAVA